MRCDADGARAEQRCSPGRVGGLDIDAERSQRCEECGSPLAGDQRYCLACGARVGAHSPQLEQLLRGVPARAYGVDATRDAGASAASAPDLQAAARPQDGGLRLPPPRVWALLVLLCLGFGVLLGHVARSPAPDALASARGPVKLVLGPSASASAQASSPSSASQSPASSTVEEAPSTAGEAEATPTPTPAPAGAGGGAAKTPAKSKGGGGSQGGAGAQGGASEAAGPAKKLPALKHVFVIMLSDEPYASVFGPSSTAPYLTGTLEHQGELLTQFDAVAHEELADDAALISGQGATMETAANCPTYSEIVSTGTGPDEQVLGSGCVYPRATQTLGGQLVAKHLTWRAYIQGMDEAPGATPCQHPTIGASDPTADQTSSTGAYATFDNPFVYFDSVLETPQCAADDVGLGQLKRDLAKAGSTPSFSYIAPDRCHDGNPTPCTPGAPAGLAQANAFLQQVVPEITGSKAYKESGLLVITVNEAPSTGVFADSSACCGQPLFPNAPSKSDLGTPRGGGGVGALLLSPFVAPGTTTEEPFNDFSLLRTIEDLFGLEHLGYAGLPAVKSFEPAMFTAGKQ
jgi:hypothetical protein